MMSEYPEGELRCKENMDLFTLQRTDTRSMNAELIHRQGML